MNTLSHAAAQELEKQRKAHGTRPLPNVQTAPYNVDCDVIDSSAPVQFCTIVYPPDIQGWRGNCNEIAVVTHNGCTVCAHHEKKLGWKRKPATT
ncbi:MAG: hypothetical protein WAX89_07690 [Alphaproteobacteria bacterium]